MTGDHDGTGGRAPRATGRGGAVPHDGAQPQLLWDLHPGYVLRPQDRVVIATTRSGLAELLATGPAPRPGNPSAGR
ncbi:hypothetical protein AB0E83_14335 [Streptomyces sp. NPDC035033]|uniref:hypothetical protein n=1 Tax=Streptomyces sp. NPDC035033 TaxID=3155368 RepID=UPI0033C44B03